MPSPAGVYFAPNPLTTKPLPYGLLSVAEVVTDTSAHWRNGIEVDGDACIVANFADDPCASDSAAKETVNAYTSFEGEAFTVYALNSCKTVGRLADADERTRRALERSETVAVEQSVMENVLAPNAYMVSTAVQSPAAGIGLLEGYAATHYGGLGILHIPRSVLTAIALPIQAQRDGDSLTSFLGTPIAAGGGYEMNLGPGGTAANNGTAWVYISGAMRLTRSDVEVRPMTIDYANNDFYSLAERTYVAVVDCLVAAVLIQLPCCEDCSAVTP